MITSYALPAQDTSEKIYNCKVLKRGFYKTYTDFINNAPSITGEFVVTQKTDSPVVAASYQLTDSLMVFDKIWGFCDGTSVFIRYPQSYINDKYFWKILELKKYSTFNYRYKNITVVTLLTTPLTAITTAAISGTASALTAKKNYEELIIDKKGKIKSLSIGQLKEWLKPYPDLYIPFKKEIAALHLPKNYNDDEAVSPETYAKEIAIMQLYFLYLNEK
jgi:hypothetical protein